MKPVRRFASLVPAVASLAIACSALAADAEKHDLKPKFTKDAESKWVLEEHTNGSVKQMETTRKAEQHQTLHITRKVSAVDETSATVELTMTRIIASTTPAMGGDKISFDSDQPADQDAGNVLAIQYRQMVGKPYTFTVALNGEITAVKPPETILSSDSADALKAKFAPLFQVKTGDTLAAVGETWEKNDTIGGKSGVALESKSKLTLAGVADGVANITINSTISFREGQLPPGMELRESGTKGDIRWSIADGTLLELKTVQAMEMINQDMGLEVISATETHLRRE